MARLSAIDVCVDVFDDYDCVIDNQPDGRRHPAHCHQIKTKPGEPHRQERDEDSYRNYQNRDKRRAPVAQEGVKDCYRKQQPNDDRIAH